MTASARLDLAPAHRNIVLQILQAHLPSATKVWAFGSRANGRSAPFSDLDLAIDAGRPLRRDEMAALSDAFCESDLPWKVDVVDWRSLTSGFARLIEAERIVLAFKD